MNALKAKLLDLIRTDGPLSVARYMELVLHDAEHGYYRHRDPFGRHGDFITAPEISQMFGELIGLFLVHAWEDLGRPARFDLVELGPGRGTLMADALRAARLRPGFGKAARLTLVETSPVLRAAQARTIGDIPIRWASRFAEAPSDAPLFLIANEFFDALPIRQFVKTGGRWRERVIVAAGDELRFALSEAPAPPLPDAEDGDVLEICPLAQNTAANMAARIARLGGIAVIIDYGHAESGFGDTLQAVKDHAFADPLAEPGEADVTAHVDFAALAGAARAAGARVHGPVTQGFFLEQLGIGARKERLKLAAPDEAADIEAAVKRLTAACAMGELFKVLAISSRDADALPGFAC